jgi:hypothetical protein
MSGNKLKDVVDKYFLEHPDAARNPLFDLTESGKTFYAIHEATGLSMETLEGIEAKGRDYEAKSNDEEKDYSTLRQYHLQELAFDINDLIDNGM